MIDYSTITLVTQLLVIELKNTKQVYFQLFCLLVGFRSFPLMLSGLQQIYFQLGS